MSKLNLLPRCLKYWCLTEVNQQSAQLQTKPKQNLLPKCLKSWLTSGRYRRPMPLISRPKANQLCTWTISEADPDILSTFFSWRIFPCHPILAQGRCDAAAFYEDFFSLCASNNGKSRTLGKQRSVWNVIWSARVRQIHQAQLYSSHHL